MMLDWVPVFSPQGVPAAPNRPIAQERSCTSVILRWLPPSSTGNCTISGYTVEYREEGKWFELWSLAEQFIAVYEMPSSIWPYNLWAARTSPLL